MTARLALLRWSWRVVRKEWRQHLLVVTMIGFGIMIATVLVASIARMAPSAESQDANASSIFYLYPGTSADFDALDAELLAITNEFDDLELVIRTNIGRENIPLVGQDVDGPLGQPWLSLLEGRYPGPGEVALTSRGFDKLAISAGGPVAIGESHEIAGAMRTLVGRYENPTQLRVAEGLVPLAETGDWWQAQVLQPTDGHPSDAALLDLGLLGGGDSSLDADGNSVQVFQQPAGSGDQQGAALIAYLIGTVLLFQVAILSSAGFTVLANRKTRQLGMLAAIGAKPSHLGSVMRLTGVVCGALGGLAGLAVGAMISVAITPILQGFSDIRLNTFDLPWLLLLPCIPLAVLTAVAAAWWPARRVTKVSTLDALSARTPSNGRVWPALVVGVTALVAGGWLIVDGAPQNSPPMIVAGAVAIIVGGLALASPIVSSLGSIATFAPLAVRLAFRDIARNRSRSAAAVAAASIAIAIPFGIGSFMASYSAIWQPNLPDNVASINFYDPTVGPASQRSMPPTPIAELAAIVPDATLVPRLMPIDTVLTEERAELGETGPYGFVVNEQRTTSMTGRVVELATPELLTALGVELPGPDTDLLVLTDANLDLDPALTIERRDLDLPLYFPDVLLVSDIPGVTSDAVITLSWLLVSDEPLSQEQRDRLEVAGQSNDIFINAQSVEPSFVAMRSAAMAIASLLALGVVAVAVALVRIEASNETRLLNVVGASPKTARLVSAATVAGLTIAAVAIAVPTTLVALTGVYLNPDEAFDFVVPWFELAVLLVALPAIGAGVAWLVTSTSAGHSPTLS